MCKEAEFKLGDLLSQYSDVTRRKFVFPNEGKKKGKEWIKGVQQIGIKSERYEVGEKIGLSKEEIRNALRLSRMDVTVKESILADDSISSSVQKFVHLAPKVRDLNVSYSDAMANIIGSGFRAGTTRGLGQAVINLRSVPINRVHELNPHEKNQVHKIVVEMQEILDELDRCLTSGAYRM